MFVVTSVIQIQGGLCSEECLKVLTIIRLYVSREPDAVLLILKKTFFPQTTNNGIEVCVA